MPNRLADSTSPYLLQHRGNPVEWHQWGPAAFEEAARRDVPILLSVGYASCHWCHVMAHESFEDDATAALMNELFVNVKVDREERPDIDAVYMTAVQTMTGHGGWPMTVFLTPDGRPFHGGTYYPPEDRPGHPSFTRLLRAIDDAWHTKRDEVEQQASRLTQAVATPVSAVDGLGASLLPSAYEQIAAAFDERNGGFGTAPKFPQAPVLEFLMRAAGRPWAPGAVPMLRRSLAAMARGGIHDLIGGGFSRYSVDDRWLVPHFEKMLYDNAQLARIYAIASGVTGVAEFARIAHSTLAYLKRDLRLDGGGFASSEDADSEGEEGRFYVFSWEEFREVTDDDAVAEVLGVTPSGNFEGRSIVHRARAAAEVAQQHGIRLDSLEADLTKTLAQLGRVRAQRERPGLDDKVVCSWNGLAIRGFADSGRVLGDEGHVEVAATTARFVLQEMRDETGRLMRSWRNGRVSGPAFCDDYAALALGLFALHRATGDATWYREAENCTRALIELFWDPDRGGFHATGHDADTLIARPKNLFDNPTPSDNSLAAEAVQHLAALSGDPSLREVIGTSLRAAGSIAGRYALGAAHALSVLLVETSPPLEIALVGPDASRLPLEAVLSAEYRPDVFVAVGDGENDGDIPLLSNRPTVGGTAAAYVCRDFVCSAPIVDSRELSQALARRSQNEG